MEFETRAIHVGQEPDPATGAVVTPIYHTNSPEECAYVLGHSGARLLFCDADQAAKIAQIRDQLPSPRARRGGRR